MTLRSVTPYAAKDRSCAHSGDSGFQAGLGHATSLISLSPLLAVTCACVKCTDSSECPPKPDITRTCDQSITHSWAQQSAVQFWISPALPSFISTYAEIWLRAAPCPHHFFKMKSLRTCSSTCISVCGAQTLWWSLRAPNAPPWPPGPSILLSGLLCLTQPHFSQTH